ncbi:MAG: hypothetical protein U1D30_07800 [Planctomycetota bacterium]
MTSLVPRLLVAVPLVFGFWWLLAGRTQLAAWQLAILPAAFLGFCGAWTARRWTWSLALSLAVGASASALVGDWLFFSAGIDRQFQHAAERERQANRDAAVQVGAAKLQQQLEANPEKIFADESPAPPTPIAPEKYSEERSASRELVFELYRRTLEGRAWDLVLSLALSVVGAFQAARMTVRPREA